MKNKLYSIIGAMAGIAGALCIAIGYDMFLGYGLFLLSSVLWIAYGFVTQNFSLGAMNVVFTVINAIGIYNYGLKFLVH